MNDLGKILFDRLEEIRISNNGKIELSDVDSLIAGFMDTIKGHISSQSDILIFNEIEKIAEQIKKVKQEVVELDPNSIGDTFIPGAALELNAVTRATEQSTNIILDAAEVIQNTALKMADKESSQIIVDKVTEIFEACNFQDVTGQRIAKTLKVLEEIDGTISVLIKSFTKNKPKVAAAPIDSKNVHTNVIKDSDLLTGPQIDAPSQSQIDDLFNQ
ncbi:chemotaxis regulator CheZ [Candidatus Arcanobacter lacustris]|uniref:Chemotaxis regulator CheZ n=1 Tax=Candidatus Arcanibacter lacustris TaxID=1607817 RepID=A0A0F5MNU1_9RICK|nr:chemotaxis regulator CheZ [Candidatus Arcanobacter lacustris]